MDAFSKLTQRRGTDSYKWDSAPEGVIPMWVADMDFETAPSIRQALMQRVEHGIFGYTRVPDSYYDAVCQWFAHRHGWQIKREQMIYTSGVVPAISAIIRALTLPGDRVTVLSPVYNCFFSSIRNCGCEVSECPLHYDRETHRYTIDFDSLEQRLSHERARLFLLCNPHNPGGRVWTRDELLRIAEICRHHGVRIISDEIHCELTLHEHHYTPLLTLPQELCADSIVCCSPTKAFNIAGLQIANIVCPDAAARERIDRAINIHEVCDVNPFGVIALQAAYSPEGEAWLNALQQQLTANYDCLLRFFTEHLPEFPVMLMEGTYLAWVDCIALPMDAEEIEQRLMHDYGVWVNAGTMYGQGGEHFIRINFACPERRLTEGLHRIERGLRAMLG